MYRIIGLLIAVISLTILTACGGGSGGTTTPMVNSDNPPDSQNPFDPAKEWPANPNPNTWEDPLLHLQLKIYPDEQPLGADMMLIDGKGPFEGASSIVPDPYAGKVIGFDRKNKTVTVYEYGSEVQGGEHHTYCAALDELKLVSATRNENEGTELYGLLHYKAESYNGLEYTFFVTPARDQNLGTPDLARGVGLDITGQHPSSANMPILERIIENSDTRGFPTMKCRLDLDGPQPAFIDALPYPWSANRPDLRMYDLVSAAAPEPSLRAFRVIHDEFSWFGAYNPNYLTLVGDDEYPFPASGIPGVKLDVYYLDERLGYFARAEHENTCELFDLHTAKLANVLQPDIIRDHSFVIGQSKFGPGGDVEYPKPEDVNEFNHVAEVYYLDALNDLEIRTVSKTNFTAYSSVYRIPTVEFDVPDCVDAQVKEELRLKTLLKWRERGYPDFK